MKKMPKLNFWMAMSLVVGAFTFTSCNKNSENVVVSEPLFQVGKAVSTKTPLAGSIKGTLLADS